MVLVTYDKYQRMLEAQSVKTHTAPKPTKERTKCPIHHPGNGTLQHTGNQKPISTKGPSQKTSVRLYPTENSFDLFRTLATIMKTMVLVSYDKYQRALEAQSVKIHMGPKPKKKKKDHMPYSPPGKRTGNQKLT